MARRQGLTAALATALIAPLLVSGASSPAAAAAAPELLQPTARASASSGPPSWIVTTMAGETDRVASEARAAGGRVGARFSRVLQGFSFRGSAQAADALRRSPGVVRVEPDVMVRATDTQVSPTWGLDRIDQRALPLSSTYSWTSTGAVRVYVVDSGIRSTHQEFTGRVQAGYSAYTGGVEDCNGHGTHVSGTVGGTTYGVSKGALIVPVRVLGCDGTGLLSTIVAGLDWILANRPAGSPGVVNMSLEAPANATFDTSVGRLITAGLTVVAAAGNDSASACSYSPARIPAAITVASVGQTDAQSTFSNSGSCVDVYAPGESVLSAYYTSDTAAAFSSGTSMSAPHVAGVVADILQRSPVLTPAQVTSSLVAAATKGVVTGRTTGSPDALLYAEPTVAVTGVLRDASATPVAGATVALDAPGGLRASATTDATGAYSLATTTGPLSLTVTSPTIAAAGLPARWTVGPAAVTVTAARQLDLTLPTTATTVMRVYRADGAPLPGAQVTLPQVGGTATSVGTGVAAVSPLTRSVTATADTDGRVSFTTFAGSSAALAVVDQETGSTRSTTLPAAALVDGDAFSVQAGTTVVRRPWVQLAASDLAGVSAALLASVPDLVMVRVGSTSAVLRFGCVVQPPRDTTEAEAALNGSSYVDAAGITRAAPTDVCRVVAVTR